MANFGYSEETGLRLEINIGSTASPNWQVAYLSPDASVHLERNSPLWGDVDTFSEDFSLPIEANRHILGNADELLGRSVYKALYKKECRLWVAGTLFLRGRIDMDDEVELEDGEVEISVVSGNKLFKDLLDDVNAQDVEIFWGDAEQDKDKVDSKTENYSKKNIQNIQIGWSFKGKDSPMKLMAGFRWRREYDYGYHSWVDRGQRGKIDTVVSIPEMMLPVVASNMKTYGASAVKEKPSFVNTSERYDPKDRYAHPYCNIQICVQNYVQNADGEWEARRGYRPNTDGATSPERMNSSPNFFVLFWLEQLLDIFLDLQYDITPLLDIDDLRGLCFINMKCKFANISVPSEPRQTFDLEDLNYKVRSGGWSLGYQLSVVDKEQAVNFKFFWKEDGKAYRTGFVWNVNPGKGWEEHNKQNWDPIMWINAGDKDNYPEITNPTLARSYATSENFPDVEAKTIIESLENAFGFKFMYDEEKRSVSVCFYRDVLNRHDYTELHAVASEIHKKENRTTGFRLKYDNSQKASSNVFTGEEQLVSGSQDTTFNYNDYRRVQLFMGDEQQYVQLIKADSIDKAYDETFYVSKVTGNGYRYKVDKGAKNEAEWNASLFEVGGYRDAEYGDCKDDTQNDIFDAKVEEKSIAFSPVISNDTNYENQRRQTTDAEASSLTPPCMEVFSEEEHHGSDTFPQVTIGKWLTVQNFKNVLSELFSQTSKHKLKSEAYVTNPEEELYVHPYEGTSPELWAEWDAPLGVDDGDPNGNPFNHEDMGFTVGILRRPSTTSGIVYYGDDFDGLGQGHRLWYQSAKVGEGCVTADSVDTFGNVYARAEVATPEEIKALYADVMKIYNSQGGAYVGLETRERTNRTSELAAYGWSSHPRLASLYPYYIATYSITFVDKSGKSMSVVSTIIGQNGEIITAQDWQRYMLEMFRTPPTEENFLDCSKALLDYDRSHRKIILAIFMEEGSALTQANVLVTALTRLGNAYDKSYNDSPDVISLKLKAEKPMQGKNHRTGDERPYNEKGEVDYERGNPRYYPVSQSCAKRGLYDKFWMEYAYFVVNRKIAVITIPPGGITMAELLAIDFTRKYKIAGYIGWINKYSCEVDDNGLGEVTIELYYV